MYKIYKYIISNGIIISIGVLYPQIENHVLCDLIYLMKPTLRTIVILLFNVITNTTSVTILTKLSTAFLTIIINMGYLLDKVRGYF